MKLFQVHCDNFIMDTGNIYRYYFPKKNTITEVGFILIGNKWSAPRTMKLYLYIDTSYYLFFRTIIDAYGYCIIPNMVSSIENPQGMFPLILTDDMGFRFHFEASSGTAGGIDSYIVIYYREYDEEKYLRGDYDGR